MKPKVLLIDTMHPTFKTILEEAGFDCVECYKEQKENFQNLLKDADGVAIRSRFKIDREFINWGTQLKFIARAGAGMENIDVYYAESKGISCLHATEGNRDAVAEHALGMLLSLFNNLNRADKQVRKGQWIREGNRGIELMGKTVGIIGYGNTGKAFARRLSGFGVTVLAYDKYLSDYSDSFAHEATMEEIFQKADILSLHLPQTEEVINLVNQKYLNHFHKQIFIINTARGKIINTADLVQAMEAGKVKGVCLDVLEYESLSFENLFSEGEELPAPLEYLIKSDKTILSPHIAGWTHESNEKIARILAGKIKNLYS